VITEMPRRRKIGDLPGNGQVITVTDAAQNALECAGPAQE
jgi:hypothetical protein